MRLPRGIAIAAALAILTAGCGPVIEAGPDIDDPDRTTTSSSSTARHPIGEHVTVDRVIDGDTIVLTGDRRIRLTGIDTPERGQCGYREAKIMLGQIIDAGPVSFTPTQKSKDRYGREIGYIATTKGDAGLILVTAGFARARYDSLDGYPRHLRQDDYRAAAAKARQLVCETTSK